MVVSKDSTRSLLFDIDHIDLKKVLWRAKEAKITDEITVELSYTSKDGEEGYPGKLFQNLISIEFPIRRALSKRCLHSYKQ